MPPHVAPEAAVVVVAAAAAAAAAAVEVEAVVVAQGQVVQGQVGLVHHSLGRGV